MLTAFRALNLCGSMFFMVRTVNLWEKGGSDWVYSLLICVGLCAVYSTNFSYISKMILDTAKVLHEFSGIYNNHQAKTNDRLGKVEYICNGDVRLLQVQVSEIRQSIGLTE